MKPIRTLTRALVLLALATTARAHDLWIEPSDYRPAAGARVSLDLKVGERFVGESVARNERRIVSFRAFAGPGEPEPVAGTDGRAPAGLWHPQSSGLYTIAYRSNTVPLEMEAEKFEHYLVDEGLDHVITARRELGESAKKGLEVYSRSVKSIVVVGALPAAGASSLTGFDRRLGMTLEIVPEQNPYALTVGDELTVRVWFRDEPLAQALIGCMPQADADREVRLRTDEHGRARFRLTHSGPTLMRVCWMTPAAAGTKADWESTWGSLTFAVPTQPAPTPPPGAGPVPKPGDRL
jgi:uncharacterized GH25 family protein